MRKILLFSSLLFVFCSNVLAQTKSGKISGTILDGSSKPVPSVTVSLLKVKDGALVKTALTNKEGKYEFENIAEGSYFVSTSSVGFDKGKSSNFEITASNNIVSVESISLQQAAKGLGEVTVTAKRPFIETKIDKTVVNVEASPTSAGATALEVLEKSPGITVNSDGGISLRGKSGVVVMLDGKPTYLSAADLANLLKNMPASALDQI